MFKPTSIPKEAGRSASAGALRVALLYAVFSGLWILLSDRAVGVLVQDPATMTLLSILKGWFFVAVTTAMLFVAIRRQLAGIATREAKLQALIHSIPDLVWLKDPQGVYLGCNRAFERFFGAPEAAIIGRTDHDFLPPEVADFFRQKDLEAIAAGGIRLNEEWITLAETGQRRKLETLKTPMHDGSGALVGVLGIGRDITEHHHLVAKQERLQAQLSQAQKMEVVGRFAGSVAHDYNNMLSAILAQAEVALLRTGEESPARKPLEGIVQAARHSAALTGQLLAFARQQPVDPRPTDLNAAVEGLLGVLEGLAGPGVQLVWRPAPGLWPVRVDATQLTQVVTNLVANARDAMEGGGRIELSTLNQVVAAPPEGAEDGPPEGEQVCLTIEDSGCGMGPEVAARIFEPFFTTKAEGRGTGLGLATVLGAVTQNQGTIQVDSRPGAGTRFRIYFPRLGPGATSGA